MDGFNNKEDSALVVHPSNGERTKGKFVVERTNRAYYEQAREKKKQTSNSGKLKDSLTTLDSSTTQQHALLQRNKPD
jgi:hypothetical protein